MLCNQFNEFISEFSKIYVAPLRNFCFRWKTNNKKGIKSLDWLCIFLIPVLFLSTFIVFNSFLTAASSYWTCYAINLMSSIPSFQKFMSRLWEIFVFVGKLIIKKASSHWTCFAILVPVLFLITFIVFNSFLTAASSYWTCYAINLMSSFPNFQKFMSRLWQNFCFRWKAYNKKASSHWTSFAFLNSSSFRNYFHSI